MFCSQSVHFLKFKLKKKKKKIYQGTGGDLKHVLRRDVGGFSVTFVHIVLLLPEQKGCSLDPCLRVSS